MKDEMVKWEDAYQFFRNQFTRLSWRLDWIRDRFVDERPFSAFDELNKARNEFKEFLEKGKKGLREDFLGDMEIQKEIQRERSKAAEFSVPASEK